MLSEAIDAETLSLLQRFRFDAPRFEELRARLAADDLDNRIVGDVAPPSPEDVPTLPPRGSESWAALAKRGLDALAAGHVGMVTLAGGMATRFGGVVKAAVPAIGSDSFLALKLRDVQRLSEKTGARVPSFLMTSFATHAEVDALAVAASRQATPVEAFRQSISLRLAPDGQLFRTEDGAFSPYAPGHGDLPEALRASGVLARFLESGGKHLFMSNVDNLGATLEPALVGWHLEHGGAVTAEVVEKVPGDRGGAPARVDGALQIVEAFRFPEAFDQDRIGVFNTNSFVLDAAALGATFPFDWFAVRKRVGGSDAVQFERLVGQLTAFLPSRFVTVPRGGVDGRFQPAKEPAELERRRPAIRALLEARGVL
ncbi:MAG: UTP--glucose-1-phosphate uridylyltransferase [Sandaracinaceae bacterium]